MITYPHPRVQNSLDNRILFHSGAIIGMMIAALLKLIHNMNLGTKNHTHNWFQTLKVQLKEQWVKVWANKVLKSVTSSYLVIETLAKRRSWNNLLSNQCSTATQIIIWSFSKRQWHYQTLKRKFKSDFGSKLTRKDHSRQVSLERQIVLCS